MSRALRASVLKQRIRHFRDAGHSTREGNCGLFLARGIIPATTEDQGMIETTDIGVLTDDELFSVAGGQLGLPEAGRAIINSKYDGSPAQAVVEGLVNTVKSVWPF
jgi:hypothetical protein